MTQPIEVQVEQLDTRGDRRWERVLLAAATFLLFVTLITVIGLTVQVQSRNKDIRKVGVIVDRVDKSSARAEAAINKAIAEGQSSAPAAQQAFADLAQIKRDVQALLGIEPTTTKGT